MKPPHRLPRAWVRLGAVASLTGALGLVSVGLLLDDEAAARPVARTVAAPVPSPSPSSSSHVQTSSAPAPAPAVQAARPQSVRDVQAAAEPADLARWVTDTTIEPTLRYAALRRLESVSPADAVTAATACARDTSPLLQVNALALLTRANSPAARAELARLDSKDQRLARALAGRK